MEYLESLPPYTVRRSSRARRVRLTVSPRSGLVVVLPKAWRGNTDEIVASKHAWATRALARVAEQRAAYLASPQELPPAEVHLRAQSRSLAVRYASTAATSARVREADGALVVSGVPDPEAQLAALRRWLVAEAKRWLPDRVGDIVRVHRLTAPSSVRISSAQTRWGSCSAHGGISLNRTLLFLPPELCDYVIAHELAHLTHLNHSLRFWSHLASIDARALEHRSRMKEAGRLVPAWVDA